MRKTERKQRFAHLLVCFYCHFTHKRWKLRTGSNLPCMYQSQEEITPSATKTLGFYLVSVLDLKKKRSPRPGTLSLQQSERRKQEQPL